jgi:hypothetical protein
MKKEEKIGKLKKKEKREKLAKKKEEKSIVDYQCFWVWRNNDFPTLFSYMYKKKK